MGKQRRMAILVACQTSFGRGVFTGISRYCKEHPGWQIFATLDNSVTAMNRALSERQADGVIAEIREPAQLRLIRKYEVPAVDVSGEWDTTSPFRVQANDEGVGKVAAKHLLERGFKHFAYYYSYRSGSRAVCFEQRKKGFMAELQKAGFTCNVNVAELGLPWHQCSLKEMLSEQEALERWLAKLPRPVGLMCADDHRAERAAIACGAKRINIPEGVAIVGVGNDDLACQLCETPLSSVEIAPQKIGYAAARVLDHAVRTRKMPSKPILIDPMYVVVRQSSNIFASDNKVLVAALAYIQEHTHEPIRVDDILRHVPICRRTLENYFRLHVGRSPSEQICRAHIERAKKLLAETALPLANVAESSGFTSASALSEVFLREMNLRPGEYRRQSQLCKP
jgi:LacI family transcriptional regulator